MNELKLRKWHRLVGFVLGPMVFLQALSGLILSMPYFYEAQDQVHSILMGRRMPSVAKFWSFVLVDSHTGGGVFGSWYNWMVGSGLSFIALTGILVYLRIRSRRRQAARKLIHPVTDVEKTAVLDMPPLDPLLAMEKPLGISWRSYAILGAGFLSVILLAAYTHFLAYRIASLDTVYSLATSELGVQTTLAHLELEQFYAGDRREGMGSPNKRLETADNYMIALTEGGVTRVGVLPPPGDHVIGEKLTKLKQAFHDFKSLTETRGAQVASSAEREKEITEAFDGKFREFISQAEEAKLSVQDAFLADVSNFRNTLGLLFSPGAILVAFLAVDVYRLEHGRAVKAGQIVEKCRHCGASRD